MITLPNNFLDSLRIMPESRAMFLHYVNEAGQFTTYYQVIDPAYTVEQQLEKVTAGVQAGLSCYRLDPETLAVIREEPANDTWVPAPLPAVNMVSLEQWKALLRMQADDRAKAEALKEQQKRDQPGA